MQWLLLLLWWREVQVGALFNCVCKITPASLATMAYMQRYTAHFMRAIVLVNCIKAMFLFKLQGKTLRGTSAVQRMWHMTLLGAQWRGQHKALCHAPKTLLMLLSTKQKTIFKIYVLGLSMLLCMKKQKFRSNTTTYSNNKCIAWFELTKMNYFVLTSWHRNFTVLFLVLQTYIHACLLM